MSYVSKVFLICFWLYVFCLFCLVAYIVFICLSWFTWFQQHQWLVIACTIFRFVSHITCLLIMVFLSNWETHRFTSSKWIPWLFVSFAVATPIAHGGTNRTQPVTTHPHNKGVWITPVHHNPTLTSLSLCLCNNALRPFFSSTLPHHSSLLPASNHTA